MAAASQTFAWRGRNARGELISGTLDAEHDDAVADQLMAGGVTPVEIRAAGRSAVATAPAAGTWQRLARVPVTPEDALLFSRQMYTMHKAGIPMLRALGGLQASSSKPALVALLADLRNHLDQGRELSFGMARHPGVFSAFYVAMIRVGEMTGRLTEVFQRLTEHLEFEIDVRERIKQALRYPTLVIAAMAIALVIINLFVLPAFAKVFAGFKAQLPVMTRVLLGFSDFCVQWWPMLAAAAFVAVALVRAWLRTPGGRYRWDRAKLDLPVAGPIIRKATLARFARSYALAARSGVPIVQAMTVVSQTVDNAYIASRIDQMRDGIERGESISRCAAATGVFTPVVMQMIMVGEETGELDNLLVDIAQMYERETDYAIKGLSASIEPILLVLIGAMVLVLALGVFMPLWNLGQAAMGRPT
jgi:MSHA biogenesis protein MshG